jgi:hypothetical protein
MERKSMPSKRKILSNNETPGLWLGSGQGPGFHLMEEEIMAKRRTDTAKWDKEWFLDLEPRYKLFWLYLLDKCDHAGFWSVNRKQAAFNVGEDVDIEAFVKLSEGRVQVIAPKKWWIPEFIDFQYGGMASLSKGNSVHESVLNLLQKEGVVSPAKDLPRTCPSPNSLSITKDISNKDNHCIQEPPARAREVFIKPTEAEVCAEFIKQGMVPAQAHKEAKKFVNFHESKGWVIGKTKMKSWRHACATWTMRIIETPEAQAKAVEAERQRRRAEEARAQEEARKNAAPPPKEFTDMVKTLSETMGQKVNPKHDKPASP